MAPDVDRAVVFTAWNRPEHFRETMGSWADVVGRESWQWRLSLEPSPYSDEMLDMWYDVTNGLDTAALVNRRRLGVLENPFRALDRAFADGNRFVVLAEEDTPVSPDVLTYFAQMQDTEFDRPVLAVCAANVPACESPPPDAAVYDTAFSPMVWGTWQETWEDVLGPTWDHDYTSAPPDEPRGWDLNITLRVMPSGGWWCVKPLQSRCGHIGESGAHCTPEIFHEVSPKTFDRSANVTTFRLESDA